MIAVIPRLVGACNRCGLFCTGDREGRRIVCEHLASLGPLGRPDASRCLLYGARWDGMPIRMMDEATGAFAVWATCAKDSEIETRVILERGIGQGCSLAVEEG